MPDLVASDGVRIHFEDRGQGVPIVFVHGWMMSGRFFRLQLESLSDRRRCVALDLRGCGRSESRAGTHTMARFAADLEELLAHLALRDVTLVGWSMGGGITMEYLDRAGPGRLRGVGLIDFPPRFREDPAVTARVVDRLRTDRARFLAPFLRRMFEAEPTPEETAWMVAETDRCATEPAVEMYRQLGQGNSTGRVYDLPALLVFPTRGWYAASLPDWRAIFPRSVVPAFARSRHAPFLEEADAFNQALVEFTA